MIQKLFMRGHNSPIMNITDSLQDTENTVYSGVRQFDLNQIPIDRNPRHLQ